MLLRKHNLNVEIRDVGRYRIVDCIRMEWMKNMQECVFFEGSWITLNSFIKSQLEDNCTVLKSITL